MSWNISSAVVVDDALGPPSQGALDPADKQDWIKFVFEDSQAEAALMSAYTHTGVADIEALLIELTSQQLLIVNLWDHYNNKTLAVAQLDILFRSFLLKRIGKAEKAQIVCDVLDSFITPHRVQTFWRLEDAVTAMAQADVVFVDFHLDDNEGVPAALKRITDNKEHLAKAKLLFFMSSRAAIETQQRVRDIVGMRTAFFEVMAKKDIEAEWVTSKLRAKLSSFEGNTSLQNIVHALVLATRGAADEFDGQCKNLEVHDLRLLDLARLATEGESVSAYLTWLASESIAAKIRKISAIDIKTVALDASAIGFTGQIKQGKVLFDLFSEVVFGPGNSDVEPLRFGEVLSPRPLRQSFAKGQRKIASLKTFRAGSRSSSTHTTNHPSTLFKHRAMLRMESQDEKTHARASYRYRQSSEASGKRYLLVLTPACDLVRCSPSKTVLCVEGSAQDFGDEKMQSKEKLYGKHTQGLRHLLKDNGAASPALITWHKDRTFMFTVRELLCGDFKRVAQMNELYAHEVKEEVLRELGRVGTQIDPPPVFALHATIKWRNGIVEHNADTGTESFYSAVLTYSEQRDAKGGVEKCPTVVLSDEFRKWVESEITTRANGTALPVKLANCVKSLMESNQFILKSDLCTKKNELQVRVVNDSNGKFPANVLLDVAFIADRE